MKSNRFRSVGADVARRLAGALEKIGSEVNDHLIDKIGDPQPASQPGDPPHVLSGELIDAQSYTPHVVMAGPALLVPPRLSVVWHNASDHAVLTEYGFAANAPYEERPWMRPGLLEVIDTVMAARLVGAF
jgi:hypothetical protein